MKLKDEASFLVPAFEIMIFSILRWFDLNPFKVENVFFMFLKYPKHIQNSTFVGYRKRGKAKFTLSLSKICVSLKTYFPQWHIHYGMMAYMK